MTFQYKVHENVPDERFLWFYIKNFLVDQCGWDLFANGGGSGNGFSLTVNDDLHPTLATWMVAQNPWIVLREPGGQRQWLIDFSGGATLDTYGAELSWDGVGYTGGTPSETQPPLAADTINIHGQVFSGGAYSPSPTRNWTGSNSYHVFLWGDDAARGTTFTMYPWIAAARRLSGFSATNERIWGQAYCSLEETGDSDPVLYLTGVHGSTSATIDMWAWRDKAGAGTFNNNYAFSNLYNGSSGSLVPGGVGQLLYDSHPGNICRTQVMAARTTATANNKGVIKDLFWVAQTERDTPRVFKFGTQEYIVISWYGLMMPWNRATVGNILEF